MIMMFFACNCRKARVFFVVSVAFCTGLLGCDVPDSWSSRYPDVGVKIGSAACKGQCNGHGDDMQDFSSVGQVNGLVGLCVCDGHKRGDFARYAAIKLLENTEDCLRHPEAITDFKSISPEAHLAITHCDDPIKKAATYAFFKTDYDGRFSDEVEYCTIQSFQKGVGWGETAYTPGTTALMALFHPGMPKKATIAWAGDSVAMVVRADGTASLLTPAHRPMGAEAARIKKMGGMVKDDRVIKEVTPSTAQTLGVSRSLGDNSFLGVIPDPEIVTELLGVGDALVLCSDGVTDGFLHAEEEKALCLVDIVPLVAASIRRFFSVGFSPRMAAAALVRQAREAWLSWPRNTGKFVDDISVQVCMPYEVKKDAVD